MTSTVKPLNYVEHGDLKISASRDFSHVNNQQVLPLIVHEFSRAAADMPVVFVKNADTGSFQPVALLGLVTGENLFCNTGQWRGAYIPAIVTHYPFALVPRQDDSTQLQVVLKEPSVLISETEGDALFDQQGNETPYLMQRKQALGNYYENTQITDAFVSYLNSKELLEQKTLSLQLNGKHIELSGLYLVSEQKLAKLANEEFITLRERGYLPPIYAHMGSLHQLQRLAALKTSAK